MSVVKIFGPTVVILVAIWVADQLNLWSHDLVGATVLWFLLVGFVWFMNLGDAGKDPDFFKRHFLETLGFTAFLEFFINAHVMSVPLELVGQLFLLVVVMLNALASTDNQYKPVATLTSVILGIASLALLIYSAVHVVANWDTLDKRELANELLMPIWLTAAARPPVHRRVLLGYDAATNRLVLAVALHDGAVRIALFSGSLWNTTSPHLA